MHVRAMLAGSPAHILGQAAIPWGPRTVAPIFSTLRDVLGGASNQLGSITPRPAAGI